MISVEAIAEGQDTCKATVTYIGTQNVVDQARYEQLMEGPYSQAT